jgi:hypothetical protein
VISCAREYELKLNRQALKGGQRCLPIGSDRRSSPELLPTWRDGGRRQTRFSESCGPIRQPRGDCAIQPIRRGDPFPASASPSSTAHFPDLAIRHRGGNLELERGDTGWMPSESPFWTAAQLTLSTDWTNGGAAMKCSGLIPLVFALLADRSRILTSN